MPLRTLAALVALALGGSAAYTVRPGDTLSGIASRLGTSVGTLAQLNGISDPHRILAGKTLQVPGGATAPRGAKVHVVAYGENLSRIAARYGTTAGAVARASGLSDPDRIRAGMRLSIPATSSFTIPADRRALEPHFRAWAQANAIPADLLMATCWLESGWQSGVVSSAGAVGVGQLMPGTTEFVRRHLIGVPSLDPAVPEHNIRMSARYLRFLIQRRGGDVRTALADYYQGPGSVDRNGVYAGTVRYVDAVLALRSRFG
jgi:soluble lytic murein transglycosylase-like protein